MGDGGSPAGLGLEYIQNSAHLLGAVHAVDRLVEPGEERGTAGHIRGGLTDSLYAPPPHQAGNRELQQSP